MAITLKILFLVVLAFGFLFPPEVEAIMCYKCPSRSVNIECTTQIECPLVKSCRKAMGKDPSGGIIKGYGCGGSLTGGNDETCRPIADVPEGEVCDCFTDLCNSVHHPCAWTFVQLIAISIVVVVGGAKP